MKKWIRTAAALSCAAAMAIPFAACSDKNQSADQAASFVSLDINPSIELTLDADNKVVSIYGANEDGQVLLYGETDLIGVSVEDAIGKITSLAVELGYLDEDNTVVETSVTVLDGVSYEDLLEKVRQNITATAENFGLSVSCEDLSSYSLLRKLENLKAQYPDSAEVQALTAAKLKLVLSACEAADLSFETAVGMSAEELVPLISEAHASAEQYATEAYEKAKSLATAAFDQAVGAAVDGTYGAIYMKNVALHPNTFYYGMQYQCYQSAARGLSAMADALSFAEKVSSYPLDQDQIAAIASVFGLDGEELDALKNSDGEITVKSIEAYADKLFKNSEVSAELDALKDRLSSALSDAESAILLKIEADAELYRPQLEQFAQSLRGAVMPESIGNAASDVIEAANELSERIAALLADGKIASEEVRALAADAAEKAEQTLALIQADLSDEELAEVETMKDQIKSAIEAARNAMQTAIGQAEAQAREKLALLKSLRQSQEDPNA